MHSVIINDMKTMNRNSKNVNVNKKLQKFILSLLQDPNEDASKRSLNVMIELYKRRIWNDDKTVNAIWEGGVMHSNPKIVAAACKFFLVLEYDYESDDDQDSEEAEDAA